MLPPTFPSLFTVKFLSQIRTSWSLWWRQWVPPPGPPSLWTILASLPGSVIYPFSNPAFFFLMRFYGRNTCAIILSILIPTFLLPGEHMFLEGGRCENSFKYNYLLYQNDCCLPLLGLLLSLPLTLHLWVVSGKGPGDSPAFTLPKTLCVPLSFPPSWTPTPSLGLSAVSVMNSNCEWVYGLSHGASKTQTNQGMWLAICLCP